MKEFLNRHFFISLILFWLGIFAGIIFLLFIDGKLHEKAYQERYESGYEEGYNDGYGDASFDYQMKYESSDYVYVGDDADDESGYQDGYDEGWDDAREKLYDAIAADLYVYLESCGFPMDSAFGSAEQMLDDYFDGRFDVLNQSTVNYPASTEKPGNVRRYTVNKYSGIFHWSYCSAAKTMSAQNREYIYGTRQDLIDMGYKPCNWCNP